MAIDKKLKAVNRMLRAVNMEQLNSWEEIDPAGISARDELEDVAEEVQARSWYFNEETVTLQVDTNGEILLSDDVLSLQHTTDVNIIKRGSKLYDKNDNTYIFEESQEVNIVYLLEFEELPPEALDYIINEATYIFQSNFLNQGVNNALAKKIQDSLVKLLQIDAMNRDTSILGLSDNQNFIGN